MGAMSEAAVARLQATGELTGAEVTAEKLEMEEASQQKRASRCLGILSRVKTCITNIGFHDFTPKSVELPPGSVKYTGEWSYRGDVTRSMDDIFRKGWRAKGNETGLSVVQVTSDQSAYVTSSMEKSIGESYSEGQGGYYIIDNSARRGIDLHRSAGSPHKEVLYPGGIRPTEVYGYVTKEGKLIRNPHSMRPGGRRYLELTEEIFEAKQNGHLSDPEVIYN